MRNHLTSISTPLLALLFAVGTLSVSTAAQATSSAELYTSASYSYGRFEARVQFAGGDGVVSSFFLWKDASEMKDVFWNELDLETVWADCELKTNSLYGMPEANHTASSGTDGGWCTGFHTYAYEWTPDYVAWFVDGMELRRETGADSTAFRDNAAEEGMQFHFNVWPGDSTFGGNFTEAILPVHEYVNWVQYSSYADGEFTLEWREDFAGSTPPEGWVTGNWGSPKGLSDHSPENVSFSNGYAIISLTTDDATGPAGAAPMDSEGGGPVDDPSTNPGSGGSDGDGTPDAGSGGMPGLPGDSGTGGDSATPSDPSGTGGATASGAGGSGTDPSIPPGDQPAGTGGDSTMVPAAGHLGSEGGCAVGGGTKRTPWGGVAFALALGAAWILRRRDQNHGAHTLLP